MKKTLIALSLAALPVAAMADVTLYGQVKAGVAVQKNSAKVDDVTVVKGDVTTGLVDFGSRIGFKGKEDLGNGVAAIWKLENGFSVAGGADSTSSGWNGREAYIGLETGAGTIRAGKIATQIDEMGVVDPWEYSSERTPALGLAQFTRTGEKVLSVRYDTPEFAGFQANVQFVPRDSDLSNGGGLSDGVRKAGSKDTSSYYLGLNYENSGFFAKYGLGYKHAALANGKDGSAHRLEGGYDANNIFVGLGVQYTNGWDAGSVELLKPTLKTLVDADEYSEIDALRVKQTEVALTGAYRLGNVTPKLTYVHGFEAKDKADGEKLEGTKYDQVIVGADYDFSKRTTAFAQAGWLRVGSSDDKVTSKGALVGLRHKF